jgi:glycosidase
MKKNFSCVKNFISLLVVSIAMLLALGACSFVDDVDNPAKAEAELSLKSVSSEPSGTLMIIFKNWNSGGTVYLPGDWNGWNPSGDSIIVAPGATVTNIYNNAITADNIALGNSTSEIEFKVLNQAGNWNSAWGFSSWSLNDVSVSDVGRQVHVACEDGDVVTITFDVDGATSITASTAVSSDGGDGSSGDGFTVYFKAPSGWNNTIRVYYWGGDSGTTSWPGEAMTSEGSGWYSFSFSGTTTSLIFNNNGSPQTGDLTRSSDGWYMDSVWHDSDPEGDDENGDDDGFSVYFKAPSDWNNTIRVYYWGGDSGTTSWPGMAMSSQGDGWYSFNFSGTTTSLIFNNDGSSQTADLTRSSDGWYMNGSWYNSKPEDDDGGGDDGGDDGDYTPPPDFEPPVTGEDFREETIYFVMTTRFYDGDPNNNVYCWDDTQAGNVANNDPAWRGDFKGLVEKLDYIKALGFTAIWITPVVKNASGYDYHGYHAINHSEVDPRYKSPGYDYQRLIDEVHARGMKIIQDVVFNHTGNFGEENLHPLFYRNAPTGLHETIDDALTKTDPRNLLPANYDSLTPGQQYQARIYTMKEDHTDTAHIYHHEKSMSWEGYTVQTGQIAGDCVDLNTENPTVTDYLVNAYNQFIDMGVDAFRIDTVKHVSRLSFNRELLPGFRQRGGNSFFMFGEVCTRYRQVWNHDNPNISSPFYTWVTGDFSYPWATREQREASALQFWNDNMSIGNQPTSDNHRLVNNQYRTPNYSQFSGQAVIDFPMHWNFANAWDAYNVALGGDHWYNDATWNVTYVDSHDYAPDTAPENQRFALGQDVWAENLSLMFTFRGIPCIYYGSEIEFKKGHVIDVGPNAPLENTGRAYFGNHIEGSVNVMDFGVWNNASGNIANTLNHPLARHIQRLNRIRRAIPALQKGQYSTDNISGGMAYKRRYTNPGENIDSFALVTVSGSATFYGIPNGTYVDAVTGHVQVVNNNTLSALCSGKGNIRVYVLDLPGNPAPGKIGSDGLYIK